jgi:hypothetical protein
MSGRASRDSSVAGPSGKPIPSSGRKLLKATNRFRSVSWFLIAALLGAMGCSKSGPEFSQVEGTVTLNGKPLPNVEIVFMSEIQDSKANPASAAYTNELGRYSLWCSQADTQGAVVGTYRVCVHDIAAMPLPAMEYGDDPVAAKAHRPGPLRVPSRYSDSSKTPFRDVKVSSGKLSLDFDVKTTTR